MSVIHCIARKAFSTCLCRVVRGGRGFVSRVVADGDPTESIRSVSRITLSCTRVGTLTIKGPCVGRGVSLSVRMSGLRLLGRDFLDRGCRVRSGTIQCFPGRVGRYRRQVTSCRSSVTLTGRGAPPSQRAFPTVRVRSIMCARGGRTKRTVVRTYGTVGSTRTILLKECHNFPVGLSCSSFRGMFVVSVCKGRMCRMPLNSSVRNGVAHLSGGVRRLPSGVLQ